MIKNYLIHLIVIQTLFCITDQINGQIDTTDVNKLFEMSLADLMNQEIITSSKFLQKPSEAASSISVITSDEIKYLNYSTLGEALNSRSGIYLSNDKNYIYTGSRGFSRPTDYNNRIVIMVDGHICNEVVYGSAFMGNELGLNLKNIERIEIIRGPGASVYGSGAMLNIINIIMKKGEQTDGLQVSAGTGSFGKNEISAVFGKKIKNTDISASVIGGLSDGEDYYFPELDTSETNNGISEGMDWEKYAGLQGKLTHNNLYMVGMYTHRLKGIPTGAFETDLTGDVSSDDDRYFIEAGYTKELNEKNSLYFRAYYDDYCYTGSYPAGGYELYDASKGRWVGSEIQYYLAAGKRNIITAGLEYKYIFRSDYKEWDNSEVYFNNNFPFSFFSLYAQDQFKIFNILAITAGIRYDKYSIFGNAISPRLALIHNYSETSSIKLLYNEAFRIPNMYEAYYESVNSHKSNPGIEPEKIKSVEVAWNHTISKNLYGSLSLYSFNLISLIDLTLDESDGLTEFRNIGKAQGKGIETELRYQPGDRAGGYINFTLQRAEDKTLGQILTNSPGFMIKTGLIYPVAKLVYVSPEFFFETGRKTLSGDMTDNVCLFNLSLRTGKFLRYFDFSFKIRNIFDSDYKYPGGYEHAQDALVQDSRNLFIQLNARF